MHSEGPLMSLFITSAWYDLNLSLVQHDNGSHKTLFIPYRQRRAMVPLISPVEDQTVCACDSRNMSVPDSA